MTDFTIKIIDRIRECKVGECALSDNLSVSWKVAEPPSRVTYDKGITVDHKLEWTSRSQYLAGSQEDANEVRRRSQRALLHVLYGEIRGELIQLALLVDNRDWLGTQRKIDEILRAFEL